MILVSHIINALDLSSINAFDSLSNNGIGLSSVDPVNKPQASSMLPQHNILMNSSAYSNYFCQLISNTDLGFSR